MADTLPPDAYRYAGTRWGETSGKVADFRYKRSSQHSHGSQNAHDDGRRISRQGSARPQSRKPSGMATQAEGEDIAEPNGRTERRTEAKRQTTNRNHTQSRARGVGEAYAALDLGTNNCRLMIARPSGRDFTVIDAFSRVVKLGEGLATTGRLSQDAMDRTLRALSICADKLKRRKVRLARSVATEACRRAANGPAFIERVREETGIALDIISAEEEARLAVLGCYILLEGSEGPAMIFDIGGGSTELVLVEPGGKIPRIIDWQSVPWGVVSLTDTVGRQETGPAERIARYRKMREIVSSSFSPFADRIADARAQDDIRLLGTSGTVTTLASLHLELPQYDRNAVDGLIVPSRAMREISENLSIISPAERSELPCIGRERSDLVVAGCAILESILDLWPSDRLGVADRGIREGILRSLMAAERHSERSLLALQKMRERSG